MRDGRMRTRTLNGVRVLGRSTSDVAAWFTSFITVLVVLFVVFVCALRKSQRAVWHTSARLAPLDNIPTTPSRGASQARQDEGSHGSNRALPSLCVRWVGVPDGGGQRGGGGVSAPQTLGRRCRIPLRRRRAPRHAAQVVGEECEAQAQSDVGVEGGERLGRRSP